MSNDSRVPAGTPTGGQFAAQARTEASVDLAGAEVDAAIDRAIASFDETELDELGRHQSADVRYAVAQNPDTSVDTLQMLTGDPDETVRGGALWALDAG